MQLKYARTLRKKILTLNEMYSNVIIGIEYLITCVYEKLKKKKGYFDDTFNRLNF